MEESICVKYGKELALAEFQTPLSDRFIGQYSSTFVQP
jgi:hypothetical protein